jgi:hypothetical protein
MHFYTVFGGSVRSVIRKDCIGACLQVGDVGFFMKCHLRGKLFFQGSI